MQSFTNSKRSVSYFYFSLSAPSYCWYPISPISCSGLPTVLISQGCHSKVPQAGWLHITGTYSLTMFEARHLKSSCQKDHAPSEGSREESFPASVIFCWLQAFLGLWPHNSILCLPPAHGFLLSVSPAFVRTPVIGFRAHPTPSMISP